MKFNEKLMELRKKEGLSQEELGYKLNVTRQTVSKWELGQTTPEMEKLVEISKIFNISVDELIHESETAATENIVIEDQPIEEKNKKSKKIVILIVGLLIIVLALIMIKMFTAFTNINEEVNSKGSIFDKFFSIVNQAVDNQSNIISESENIIGNAVNQIDITKFNSALELYKGSNSGRFVKNLLDEVITINKTEDRKVTIKYMETEVQDTEEITNLKKSFDDSKNFQVSFEYDTDGYINKVIVERVVSEFEITKFNSSFELLSGTKKGTLVATVLDRIITSNKTEERKVTVKYMETETQDEDEIKNIKHNIESFDDFEISFEYDADGFIKKAIIEKL